MGNWKLYLLIKQKKIIYHQYYLNTNTETLYKPQNIIDYLLLNIYYKLLRLV